ncbi:MAG: Asp-tRNA(Asn)/Glu-tRNA(Gln) amidotransferase subunit GatB [Patescibacteria group bacterium]
MSDKKYILTIGLEIHAELKTQTKMFCNSKNDPDEEKPNVNTCPVCMGHPGTLPVINKQAVKHVLSVGTALGGELADFTEFDRKNYFYPDIPKGYQLSQYKYPLVSGGKLNGVLITRVHLEEDTATSLHEKGDLSAGEVGYSLVDFNRAGVPLMELVTEPVIQSAKEASNFARELQLLMRCLKVSDANMEKGEMRVEANISVSDKEGVFGTKVEVKNLNSFKAVERAIEYEFNRQVEALESGEKLSQETRGWDDAKQVTFSQRMKEESHDYRYFPDPDLPKLMISEIREFSSAELKKALPELPWETRARLIKNFGDVMTEESREIFVRIIPFGNYFSDVIAAFGGDSRFAKIAINYSTSDLVGLMKKDFGDSWEVRLPDVIAKIPPAQFAKLMRLVGENKISSRGAKDILSSMYRDGGDPEVIANSNGLIQKSDEGELKKIVQSIIEANPKVVADYKAGKESVLQFLVGQGMKATKGSANPEMLANLIREAIFK